MRQVPKSWGSETWIVNNEKYCCKFLNFNKGAVCSLHCHHKKEETFYVSQGAFEVFLLDVSHDEVYEDKIVICEGQTLDVPQFLYHSMKGLKDVNTLLEVSTHHDDEDSFRMTIEEAEFSKAKKSYDKWLVFRQDYDFFKQSQKKTDEYHEVELSIIKTSLPACGDGKVNVDYYDIEEHIIDRNNVTDPVFQRRMQQLAGIAR